MGPAGRLACAGSCLKAIANRDGRCTEGSAVGAETSHRAYRRVTRAETGRNCITVTP